MRVGTYNWKRALKVSAFSLLLLLAVATPPGLVGSEVTQSVWMAISLMAYVVIFLLRVMLPWACGKEPFFFGLRWELAVLALFCVAVMFLSGGARDLIAQRGWNWYAFWWVFVAALLHGFMSGASQAPPPSE